MIPIFILPEKGKFLDEEAKKMIRKIVFLSSFIILASLNFAWELPPPFIDLPGVGEGPKITSEQAKEIVRQWEGDPNLQLPEPQLNWTEGDLLSYPQYEFAANRYYVVDAIAGYVCLVIYKDPPANPQWLLSPEEVKQIAQAFCTGKYPGFNQINWISEVEKEEDFGHYTVDFNAKAANGAWMLNFCSVDVHPDTGEILNYSATIPSVPPPTWEPEISMEQAIQIAVESIGFVEVLELGEVELSGGNGVLLWGIGPIKGILPDGSVETAWVIVDAVSGLVRCRDYAKSHHPPMPPRGHIMINGKLVKRSEGPLFLGEKCFISVALFKILGGDLNKVKAKRSETLLKDGKMFVSTELLKRALNKVVWDTITDKERRTLYIILYGDTEGLELLNIPREKKKEIEDKWFKPQLPKGSDLTEAKRKWFIDKFFENQKKYKMMRDEIIKVLEGAKLLANAREIKGEFPKADINREMIAKSISKRKHSLLFRSYNRRSVKD